MQVKTYVAPAAPPATVPPSAPTKTYTASPPPFAPAQVLARSNPQATESVPAPVAPAASVQPVALSTPAHNAHCEAVATARADDAAANGKDEDLQKAVQDGTYADCVKWEAAHPGGD
jgi:hypothetical protein